MVFLPPKYSKKIVEEPYHKLTPEQFNKILSSFIYPAFFEIRANEKQCRKKLFLNSKLNALHLFSIILNNPALV